MYFASLLLYRGFHHFIVPDPFCYPCYVRISRERPNDLSFGRQRCWNFALRHLRPFLHGHVDIRGLDRRFVVEHGGLDLDEEFLFVERLLAIKKLDVS